MDDKSYKGYFYNIIIVLILVVIFSTFAIYKYYKNVTKTEQNYISMIAKLNKKVTEKDKKLKNFITDKEIKEKIEDIVRKAKPNLKDDEVWQMRESIMYSSKKFEVDWRIIIGVIYVESYFNKNAKSNKNAKGLMQVMEDTANEMEQEYSLGKRTSLYNIHDNVVRGTAYLRWLKDNYSMHYKNFLKLYENLEIMIDDQHEWIPIWIMYNQGPSALMRKLRQEKISLNDAKYPNKVSSAMEKVENMIIEKS